MRKNYLFYFLGACVFVVGAIAAQMAGKYVHDFYSSKAVLDERFAAIIYAQTENIRVTIRNAPQQ